MIPVIHILAFLFVSFAASRAMLRAKDKMISSGELIFWLAIWGSLLFIVFFPNVTNYVANIVGIGRGIDVIVYTSIVLLFYMVFRIYVKVEETEMHITNLVREIAIEKSKQNGKKKGNKK